MKLTRQRTGGAAGFSMQIYQFVCVCISWRIWKVPNTSRPVMVIRWTGTSVTDGIKRLASFKTFQTQLHFFLCVSVDLNCIVTSSSSS